MLFYFDSMSSLNVYFSVVRKVPQEMSEAILTMVTNASLILNKPRTAPPGVVGAKSVAVAPPTPIQVAPIPVASNPVSRVFL